MSKLTVDDLCSFLRKRSSEDSRIAADWADDNPQHPCVLKEVEHLEEFCRLTGLYLQHNAPDEWAGDVPFCEQPVIQALTGRDQRPQRAEAEGWQCLVREAQALVDRRGPSWAAAIVRELKKQGREEPKPRKYVVEFLISKTIEVDESEADDELQAEKLAAKELSQEEWDGVVKMRVFKPDGMMTSNEVNNDGGFWTPDKEWWE